MFLTVNLAHIMHFLL